MNPEKQRIAIAEACGWTLMDERDRYGNRFWRNGDRIARAGTVPTRCAPLPDYLHDLNAAHEAVRAGIKTENEFTDYAARLTVITGDFCPIEATAAQRAEAFLRTIGKWEES